MVVSLVVFLTSIQSLHTLARAQQDIWAEPRARMVSVIQGYKALLPEAVDPAGISAAVLDVMRNVPRHRFVPERHKSLAYADRPLPIGHGQTISQPLIVALMPTASIRSFKSALMASTSSPGRARSSASFSKIVL